MTLLETECRPSPPPAPQLGKFVVAEPRADGSHRVVFKVPPKLRPSGWSAAIPLPTNGGRWGNLADPIEVERIRADAARLFAEYELAMGRTPTPVTSQRHDLEACVNFWRASGAWKDNADVTNQGYEYSISAILDWATMQGNPAVERITAQDIEQLFAQFDDRPSRRYAIRAAMRQIMQEAKRAKWRLDNPVLDIVTPRPKTTARLWTQDDINRHVAHCRKIGKPSVAAIILTEWEIGQRLTDVVMFRHNVQYLQNFLDPDSGKLGGAFSFGQNKTKNPVNIPISKTLADLLEEIRKPNSLYLFHDDATGNPFIRLNHKGKAVPNVNRLGHVFDDFCRVASPEDATEDMPLRLRYLRHTCVVELARAGCEIPEICSITGHTLGSATSILMTYLPRDSKVAANAQRKRGLI